MQATIYRLDEVDEFSGSALLDSGVEVSFNADSWVGNALRHLRIGQRLSVDLSDDGTAIARMWIVGIGAGEQIR